MALGRLGDYITHVSSVNKMATNLCLVCDKDVSHSSFRRRIDSSPKVLAYAKSIVGLQVGRYLVHLPAMFFKLEKA